VAELQTRTVMLDAVVRPEVLERRRSTVKRREVDGGSVKLSGVIGWGLRVVVATTCREGGGGAMPWLGR
jgi:hypothetical protein